MKTLTEERAIPEVLAAVTGCGKSILYALYCYCKILQRIASIIRFLKEGEFGNFLVDIYPLIACDFEGYLDILIKVITWLFSCCITLLANTVDK